MNEKELLFPLINSALNFLIYNEALLNHPSIYVKRFSYAVSALIIFLGLENINKF